MVMPAQMPRSVSAVKRLIFSPLPQKPVSSRRVSRYPQHAAAAIKITSGIATLCKIEYSKLQREFQEKVMSFTVEATYENGVLKPAEPLPLQEAEKVRITIESERTGVVTELVERLSGLESLKNGWNS